MTRPPTTPSAGINNPPDGFDTAVADATTLDELQALYREGSTAEPAPMLDRRILAAARAQRAVDHVRARRSRPWWKGLALPVATVAIGVLGISLAWRTVDQQELELRRAMNAADEQMKGGAAPIGPTASAVPSSTTSASTSAPEASVPAKRASAASPSELRQAMPANPSVRPAVPKPFPDKMNEVKAQASNGEPEGATVAMPMASPTAGAAAPLPREADFGPDGTREAKRRSADGMAGVTPLAASPMAAARPGRDGRSAESNGSGHGDDAATPEAWLARIRQLRQSGHDTEAIQSLARFRQRYPDFSVPDDLIETK